MKAPSTLSATFSAWKTKAQNGFKTLSRREQGLICGGVAVLIIMAVYAVYEPVSEALDRQNVALVEAEGRAKGVSGTLERYMKLKARRDAIEGRYRMIEFEEGALSYLETMIRTKAMVTSGFTIKDGPPRPFGKNHEQVPFSVRFSTANLETLIGFLQELVHGQRPLILGRLSLQKSRIGDRFDVDLDVSNLRKANK